MKHLRIFKRSLNLVKDSLLRRYSELVKNVRFRLIHSRSES